MNTGDRFVLNGLLIVDEVRLHALPPEKMLELLQRGYLRWIFAHLDSLHNLGRLVDLLANRKAGTAADQSE